MTASAARMTSTSVLPVPCSQSRTSRRACSCASFIELRKRRKPGPSGPGGGAPQRLLEDNRHHGSLSIPSS